MKSNWKASEGQGGYAPDSHRIPWMVWPAVALILALVYALMHIGAAVGF